MTLVAIIEHNTLTQKILLLLFSPCIASFLLYLANLWCRTGRFFPMPHRSICDHCQKTLCWYNLIPIISWIGQRGRSTCCHQPLHWEYLIVECLFLGLVAQNPGFILSHFTFFPSLSIAFLIALIDFKTTRIPVNLLMIGGAGSILINLSHLSDFTWIMVWGIIMGLLYGGIYIFQKRIQKIVMGAGDYILLLWVTMWLEPHQFPLFFCLLGGLSFVFALLWQWRIQDRQIPFAPMMLLTWWEILVNCL